MIFLTVQGVQNGLKTFRRSGSSGYLNYKQESGTPGDAAYNEKGEGVNKGAHSCDQYISHFA
jgi:hypothetical protein